MSKQKLLAQLKQARTPAQVAKISHRLAKVERHHVK